MNYSMIISFIVSFVIGFLSAKLIKRIYDKREMERNIKEMNRVYNLILDNVYSSKTIFLNRMGNTVTLSTNILGDGMVTIMYMIDKEDIAIFKEDKCLYTSDLVENSLLTDIICAIEVIHRDSIDDTVSLFGIIFDKTTFESKFGMKIEDLRKGSFIPKEKSDVESIIGDNETKYDIDDILDRIHNVGIENLTKSERDFLDRYSNE